MCGHFWKTIDHVTNRSLKIPRYKGTLTGHMCGVHTECLQIRVRGVLGDRVSPVPEDNAESRDCWEFLASKDSSVHATGSKVITPDSDQ